MIRRLLNRLADRLMDTAWLRSMRMREVQALRSAHHVERRHRLLPVESDFFEDGHDDGRERD